MLKLLPKKITGCSNVRRSLKQLHNTLQAPQLLVLPVLKLLLRRRLLKQKLTVMQRLRVRYYFSSKEGEEGEGGKEGKEGEQGEEGEEGEQGEGKLQLLQK
jgi:hypothetical protein